jgi:hypothetical protein
MDGYSEGCKVKAKGKLSLCLTKYHVMNTHPLLRHHAMKIYWGNGGTSPHILNLGTRWR